MQRPPLPASLFAATLLAALGGCGGGERKAEAKDAAPSAAGKVYTSEVQSVSQWIRQGGAGGDTAGLVAVKNPRGEGVLVYSRKQTPSDTAQQAAWAVVDNQVVPLNEASRKATPTLPGKVEERTWSRIGIDHSRPEADLHDVLPVPDPSPPREESQPSTPEPAPRPRPAPRQESRPAAPTPAPPAHRSDAPADTLHIPTQPPVVPPVVPQSTPPQSQPQPRPATPSAPERTPPPRDTLRIPTTPSLPDTLRIPASGPKESRPAPAPARPESTTAPVPAA